MDQQQDTLTLRDQTQRLNVDRQGDPSVDPFRNLQEEPSYNNMEQLFYRLPDQPRTLDSFYNKVNLQETTLLQNQRAQEREQDSLEQFFFNECQQIKQKKQKKSIKKKPIKKKLIKKKKQKKQYLTKNILQFIGNNIQGKQKGLSEQTMRYIAEFNKKRNRWTLDLLFDHMKNSSELRRLVTHFFRTLPIIIFRQRCRLKKDKKIIYLKALRQLGLRVQNREKIT